MTAPATTTPLTPSAYRMHLADRVRDKLFALLGPNCAECDKYLVGEVWELNHIYKRDWTPRKINKYRRNLRYWREAQEGLVNILCKDCNQTYRPQQHAPPIASGDMPEPF